MGRRTLDEFVAQYTSTHPRLGVFGFLLGLYFILPFWHVSAGEALHCFRAMAFDNSLSYPRGGSIAIPKAYVKLAQARGAELRCGVGVRRIVVKEGRVSGVALEDGTVLPATIVVSTSSLRTTVLHLVGPEHFPASYVDRVKRIRGSYIAVQAKIGLNKKLVSAGAICGGVGENVDLMSMSQRDIERMFCRDHGGARAAGRAVLLSGPDELRRVACAARAPAPHGVCGRTHERRDARPTPHPRGKRR